MHIALSQKSKQRQLFFSSKYMDMEIHLFLGKSSYTIFSGHWKNYGVFRIIYVFLLYD